MICQKVILLIFDVKVEECLCFTYMLPLWPDCIVKDVGQLFIGLGWGRIIYTTSTSCKIAIICNCQHYNIIRVSCFRIDFKFLIIDQFFMLAHRAL